MAAGVRRAPAQFRGSAAVWLRVIRADFQGVRSWRDARRPAAWLIWVVAFAVTWVRMTVGFQDVAFPLLLCAGLGALLYVSPRDNFRLLVFYLSALWFFTQLRDAADETSIEAGTAYVLNWEESWFGGTTPSAWLQEHVGGADGRTNIVSFLATFMHWTWFFFPHAVVLGAYLFARERAFRVATIMMGTFFAAVAMYYLLPTVPPWLAAENGAADGIRRVMIDVGPQIFGQSLFDDLFDLLGTPNEKAAMPSLHFAGGFIVIILGWLMRSRRLMATAFVYSLAMAFSLMYLGEHYFVDIVVGGGAALSAWFLVETALGNGPGARLGREVWVWWRTGRPWPRWGGARLGRPPAHGAG